MRSNVGDFRKLVHPVDGIFLNRWSPRAFTGEKISREELFTIFEAARWAPSAGNSQPWRFVYGVRGTPEFDRLFDLLVSGNQIWCKNASALIVCLSKTKDDKGDPLTTASYDTGAAWENMALQTTMQSWYAHGMAGFDYAKAREVLSVPADFKIEAMAAIGRLADKSTLPAHLQEREFPSNRTPIEELIFEGSFQNKK